MKCGVARKNDDNLFVMTDGHMCLRDNTQLLKRGLKPYQLTSKSTMAQYSASSLEHETTLSTKFSFSFAFESTR